MAAFLAIKRKNIMAIRIEECENLAEVILYLVCNGIEIEFAPSFQQTMQIDMTRKHGSQRATQKMNLPFLQETAKFPELELFQEVKKMAMQFIYR